jgi:hypothetical protein
MKAFGVLCAAAVVSWSCSRTPTEPPASAANGAGAVRTESRVQSGSRHTRTVERAATVITVPEGAWGGPQGNLRVGPGSATIELPCAHGTIDSSIVLDASGRFDVPGTFVREGGPTREIEDSIPARFKGIVSGPKMTLTIELSGDPSQAVGPFSLTQGVSGRLIKCL